MIPTTWVLMKNRSMKDYNCVLMTLKAVAQRNSIILNPRTVMIDFELAAMNSYILNFPNIKVKGCHFHFGQAIFRKFSSHFKCEYHEHQAVRDWFSRVFVLALIPEHVVEHYWTNNLLLSKPAELDGDKWLLFCNYFQRTYLCQQIRSQQSLFKPEMWTVTLYYWRHILRQLLSSMSPRRTIQNLVTW